MTETSEPPLAPSGGLARTERILIGLGLTAMFFTGGIGPDGVARFEALTQLIEGRGLSDTGYSMVGPVFATPLWLLGKLLGSARWWVGKFNYVVFLGGIFALWRILRPHVPASFLRKVTLLLMVASMFPRAAMSFYGEMFTTVLVATGALALAFRPSLPAWTAITLGIVNTPATLVGGGLLAALHAWRQRRLRYLLVPLVAAVLIMAESGVRRGSPFLSGYEGNAGPETIMPYSGLPGFSYPLLLGVLSIVLSFGKGLLFYTPGLFLPVRTRLADLAHGLAHAYGSWLAFLAGLVLVYSRWWSWYGGWHWGPRFFLIASWIACFALALALVRPSARAWVNGVVLLVLLWSCWVGLDGLMLVQAGMEVCTDNAYRWEALCWYVPEFSALFRPFVAPRPWNGQQLAVGAFMATVAVVLAAPLVLLTTRQGAAAFRPWLARARSGWRF